MLHVIKNTGQTLAITILAICLSLAIGNTSLHRLHHIVGGTTCSYDHLTRSSDFSFVAKAEIQNSPDSPLDNQRPDESTPTHNATPVCWLAFTSSQAATLPTMQVKTEFDLVTHKSVASYRQLQTSVVSLGFLVRGPPGSFLSQS